MRILLIHQAFCGPNDPGGTRHYELAKELASRGHEVTIITSRYSYLTGAEKADCTYTDGIRVHFAPALSGLHRSYFQRTLAFLSFAVSAFFVAMRCEPQDLILGTSPPIFQCFPAILAAGLRRRPFVLEVRDLWPEFAIALGVLRNPLLITMATFLERLLYRFASVIVVNSPAYRSHLQQAGVPHSKIALVTNGVEAAAFDRSDDGEAFRAEYGISNNFVVMYTGALGLANGLESLLQAACLLRNEADLKIVIVGDGKHKSKLQREAQDLNLTNVLFVPAQPKTRMAQILAAADICVAMLANVPCLHVTYPNKVFDYMAAARPTVLAIEGPIREVLEMSGGGVCVRPGDSHDLADAIRRMRLCQTSRAEMGINARNYVERHFARSEQAAQFAHLLAKACSSGNADHQKT